MITQDIMNDLEIFYPKKLAEEWDNVGLLLGDSQKDIKKIQLSIDATEKSIDNAIENSVDMIITHHPFIFKGIKSIDYSTVMGRKIQKAIKNDINIISLHTNLDSAVDGLNEYILSVLGIETSKILDKNPLNTDCGIGRIYKLKTEESLEDYIKFIKEKLGIENIRVVTNDIQKKIKKIALVNGSGMSYWRKAKKLGVDLFITGDVGYHEALEALENDFSIVDIGHFEAEKHFSTLLKRYFEKKGIDVIIYNDGPVFKSY